MVALTSALNALNSSQESGRRLSIEGNDFSCEGICLPKNSVHRISLRAAKPSRMEVKKLIPAP